MLNENVKKNRKNKIVKKSLKLRKQIGINCCLIKETKKKLRVKQIRNAIGFVNCFFFLHPDKYS